MFQTGIHHFLQSWASDFLTQLMLWITSLGYREAAMGLIILVIFGISLRKGFLLFQLMAWTALIGSMAKRFFGLPRPFFVDDGVRCLDPYFRGITPMPGTAGSGFWSLPADQAIEAYRSARLSFGFPSGHTSGAVAFWGGADPLLQTPRRKVAGRPDDLSDRPHPALPGGAFPGRHSGWSGSGWGDAVSGLADLGP